MSFLMLFLFAPAFNSSAQPLNSFQTELKARQAKYQIVFQNLEATLLEAKLDQLLEEAKVLVPDSQKTAADYRVLGSIFFSFDKEAALAFNLKAFETEKKDPNLLFDLALLYHRKGSFQKAFNYYMMLGENLEPPHYALLADCYLNLGQPKQALTAWKKADFGNHHTAIDRNIWMVYGDAHPYVKRQNLIKIIRKNGANKQGKLIDLLALGLDWEKSWWEGGPNEKVLTYDRAFFEKEVSEPNKKAFMILVKLGTSALFPEDLEAQLTQDNLLINGGDLPTNSKLVRLLMNSLPSDATEAKHAIMEHHQASLEKRAKSKIGDHDALNILANYFANVDPQLLKDWYKLGWEKYNDAKFLKIRLVSELESGSLDPNNKQLLTALETFPHDPFFWQIKLNLETTLNSAEKADLISKWAMAEFRGLQTSSNRFADALDEIFKLLEQAL